MMMMGKAIATFGIWGAVAVVGSHSPNAGAVIALFATICTCVIWSD